MDRQPLTDRLGDRLLAEYGGAAAAYSLRALNGNGDNVVRVRRASDNDEQDFTAAQVSDGTLESFCGVGDGFVATWYDQSGNGNDATQSVAGNQPKIVDGGSLVAKGIDFDATDDYLNLETAFNISTDFAIFGTVYSSDFVIGGRIFHADGSNNIRVRNSTYDFRYRSNGVNYDFGTGNSFTNNNQSLFSFLNSGDEHSLFVNGSLKGQNTITDNFLMSAISDSSTGITLGGAVSELIIYPSDQSATRTAIEDNINAHYNIYP